MNESHEYTTIIGAMRGLIHQHHLHAGTDFALLRRKRNPMIYKIAQWEAYQVGPHSKEHKDWEPAVHLQATELGRLSQVLQLNLFPGSNNATA